MSYPKSALFPALALSLTVAAGSIAFAQSQKQTQDPSEKPRNVKPELKKAYKDWLDKDVTYIITDEERKAFKKLATDDEREHFIEEFWRRRDPDPDTGENEFKEEYYERIAYANENFASGIPGWKTDRGRIWIMYGKPDGRETHPMGGSYDRPSYEGGGNTSTYPFEKWFYRYIPGVGSGIEIEFVDPSGSGEYRIARDANEKDALAHVPGSNRPDIESNFLYRREQDSPFAKIDLLWKLDKAPEIDRPSLGGTGGPKIDENPLNFDVRADYFKLSDG